MTKRSQRTDNSHLHEANQVAYPSEGDARGSARIRYGGKNYYLGPHGSPKSYVLYGTWRHIWFETGTPPTTRDVRQAVDRFLSRISDLSASKRPLQDALKSPEELVSDLQQEENFAGEVQKEFPVMEAPVEPEPKLESPSWKSRFAIGMAFALCLIVSNAITATFSSKQIGPTVDNMAMSAPELELVRTYRSSNRKTAAQESSKAKRIAERYAAIKEDQAHVANRRKEAAH